MKFSEITPTMKAEVLAAMEADKSNPISRVEEIRNEFEQYKSNYNYKNKNEIFKALQKLNYELKGIAEKYPLYFKTPAQEELLGMLDVIVNSLEKTIKRGEFVYTDTEGYDSAQKKFDQLSRLINADASLKEIVTALTELKVFVTEFFGDEKMDPKYRSLEDKLNSEYKSYRALNEALADYVSASKFTPNTKISEDDIDDLKDIIQDFKQLVSKETSQSENIEAHKNKPRV